MSLWLRAAVITLATASATMLVARPAEAVPSFAAQTGQPCTTCHVGGFGPQLTPLGRAFKIGGYTQSGGEGLASWIPLSAMVQSSLSHTSTSVPADTRTTHYATNDNFAFDQINGFLAGRIGDYSGIFSQFTYSPIQNASHLDNTDIRPFTTTFDIGADETELRIGTTINNTPTVQDPFNTTFAWGFPYIASSFAPSPAAQPVLWGAFGGNTIGYTAYAWYDHKLYLEGGAYQTMSSWLMARLGTYNNTGNDATMPYARAAYEWNWNNQSAHVGAVFMQSSVNPGSGRSFDGSNGRNKYTDYAIDGSYAFLGDGSNIVTVMGVYTHEDQNLLGAANAANAGGAGTFGSKYSLNQIRLSASYWYQNTYGVTLGWQNTWGPANPLLYQTGAEVTGSANGKPNTNAFILEGDWVPFGKAESWGSPFANLKLGAQVIAYTQFNGGSSNYDGFGRSAYGNDTLYLYAWLVF